MSTMQNFMLSNNPLSLERIRSTLIRLEETIIFGLIERAQFAYNSKIYERGAMKELTDIGYEGSWLEWFLKETETFHAKARRYTSPDEYPYTSDLPKPLLPPLDYPPILHPNNINVNPSIQDIYINSIVPRITKDDDDLNYGSAATLDVEILQAISKRVHYGKFVSESKFVDNPAVFIPHIRARNKEELDKLITKPEVEKKLLQRVRNKAQWYGQDLGPEGQPLLNGSSPDTIGYGAGKIDVQIVVELYESHIIPLTKEVEVDYLLKRLNGLSSEEIEALSKPKKEI